MTAVRIYLAAALVIFTTHFATAAEPKVATTDEFLVGQITMDPRVHLPQGGIAARIPVSLSLTNTGKEPLKLVSPNVCRVHNYNITLPNNDVVAAKGDIHDCGTQQATTVLAAGETIYASNTLTLSRQMLQEGRRYFVVYEFWGVRMKRPFTIFDSD